MDRPERPDPELDPTSATEQRVYEEVRTNHLSPMGQVDDIGRFARGVGPERLTRWFRIGLGAVFVAVAIGLVASIIG